MDRQKFENIRAGFIAFAFVSVLLGGFTVMLVFIQPTKTCLEWTENYRLDGEVCWGYGEDEREFAPPNKDITSKEFEEIVTRFYENR